MYKVIYTGELEKVAGKAVFGATMKVLVALIPALLYFSGIWIMVKSRAEWR